MELYSALRDLEKRHINAIIIIILVLLSIHVASVQILKHAVASPLLTHKGQLGNTRSCYDVILTLTTYLSIVVQTMYQQA